MEAAEDAKRRLQDDVSELKRHLDDANRTLNATKAQVRAAEAEVDQRCAIAQESLTREHDVTVRRLQNEIASLRCDVTDVERRARERYDREVADLKMQVESATRNDGVATATQVKSSPNPPP